MVTKLLLKKDRLVLCKAKKGSGKLELKGERPRLDGTRACFIRPKIFFAIKGFILSLPRAEKLGLFHL